MDKSFKNYLIEIGIRSHEFIYTDKQLFENKKYFKQCFNDGLSPYKALTFLYDNIEKNNNEDDK